MRHVFGRSSIVRNRDRMALTVFGLAFAMTTSPVANAQDDDPPMVVDVPPYRGDLSPSPAPRRDEISGIRIESNGALITGPLNARRVYIPLDRAEIPPGFRGVWAGAPEICAPALAAGRRDPSDLPDGSLEIRQDQILSRKRLAVVQLFVPLPAHFTLAMLESGRPLNLPTSRYRDAEKILVIFAEPDGARDYLEFTLLDDGRRIDVQKGHGHETAGRCSS